MMSIFRIYTAVTIACGFVFQHECNATEKNINNWPSEWSAASNNLVSEKNHLDTEEKLNNCLKNKTIYGITGREKKYALYFEPPGTLYLLMEDGRLEKGSYTVDNGVVHGKWPTIHGGNKTAVKYYCDATGNAIEFIVVSNGNKLFGRIQDGDVENLVSRHSSTN